MDLTDLAAHGLPPVEDRLLLDDLFARYNLSVDLGDADGWVGCFEPAGRFTITGHGAWAHEAGVPVEDLSGAEALRAFMGDVHETRSVRHWSTNVVHRLVDSDTVRALSLMTVWDLAAPRAGEMILTGVMRDVIVRRDPGTWRFRSRHLTLDK